MLDQVELSGGEALGNARPMGGGIARRRDRRATRRRPAGAMRRLPWLLPLAFAVFALAGCGGASGDHPAPDRPRPEELVPKGGHESRRPAEHAAPLARVA